MPVPPGCLPELPWTLQINARLVLLFPEFELLDAYGPLEMWGNLKGQVTVSTVAEKAGNVKSSQGPFTVAEFGFDNCPKLDLLLVPVGFGVLPVLQQKDTLDWLKTTAAEAELTMSVCNGASLLAAVGILDGYKVATNKPCWALAAAPGPKMQWVKQARWVGDGEVVTSSGVSAGIDMSLHVIQCLCGEEAVERLAPGTEYERHRDPFAKLHGLADAVLRHPTEQKIVYYERVISDADSRRAGLEDMTWALINGREFLVSH